MLAKAAAYGMFNSTEGNEIMTRTITREEATRLGRLAWFIFVNGNIVWQTNVSAK